MAYSDIEKSEQQGRPVELYWIDSGTTQIRFCNKTEQVTFNGSTYDPLPCRRTELTDSNTREDGSLTIWLPRNSEPANLFLGAGLSNLPKITVYRGHLNDDLTTVDPDNGIIIFNGRIAIPSYSGDECKLECRSLISDLGLVALRRKFSSNCPYFLYRTGCNVTRALYTVTVEVLNVTGEVIDLDMPTQEEGYYEGGLMFFENQWRMITRYAGAQRMTILAPMEGLEVGDFVDISAGCDHTATTCRTRFNNLDNFGGWGFIPTINYFESGLG